MSDPQKPAEDPFELEPEKQRPAEQLPEGDAASAPGEPKAEPREPSYEAKAAQRREAHTLGGEVDDRTLAERSGEVLPRGNEKVPKPEGWPKEIFRFPLRAPGIGFLVLGGTVLFVLDLSVVVEEIRFLGWLVKLLLFAFLLRAQFQVIGTSAAGRDVPKGWREALAFDRDDLSQYWRTMLVFGGVLAPGSILFFLDRLTPGLLLLALGSMYATVVAMGAALRDRSLKWPWNALKWMTTRPLHCLAGSFGWWVLMATELCLHGMREEPLMLVAFLSIILRAVGLYTILLSARAIGVMGRAWTPG